MFAGFDLRIPHRSVSALERRLRQLARSASTGFIRLWGFILFIRSIHVCCFVSLKLLCLFGFAVSALIHVAKEAANAIYRRHSSGGRDGFVEAAV